MKFVALLSGGKDSVFSAMEAMSRGHELICGANLAPSPTAASAAETMEGGSAAMAATGDSSGAEAKIEAEIGAETDAKTDASPTTEATVASSPVETDSYMYQTAGHDAALAMAECLGVPMVRGFVRGTPKAQVCLACSPSGAYLAALTSRC